MKKTLGFLAFSLLSGLSMAQSNFAPLNEEYYHRIDRYEIKSGKLNQHFFTVTKPYKRSDIVAFFKENRETGLIQSKADQFNDQYFRTDSWEWDTTADYQSKKAIAKHLYQSKSDFYHARTKDFDVHISPVLYVGAGRDNLVDDMLYTNTRGIEVRGMIDNKVGFYTYLTDNQLLLPDYVNDYRTNLVVPHEGFWKGFKEGQAVDFLQARGYITFEATKHINIQFGHDRFNVGHGFRSLAFSDNPPPALFLKGNAKVWKLNYFFLLNRFTANTTGNINGLTGTGRFPDKYVAMHHFSFNIGKKLNIGVFESVVFAADSTTQGKFDAAYLNPIIFYRAIEQQNGSSDNVIIGADFKWNVIKNVQLYGQIALDEFLLDNVKKGNGWWANKFAAQLGVKYVDAFGIANLDLQAEANRIRPYTFSHDSDFGSYSGYRQSLAHPLGANLNELIGVVRYQPIPRLNIISKLILVETGRDDATTNWGGDILKINTTRQQSFNNEIAQGFSNTITFANLTMSYMLKHNLFAEAMVLVRNSKSDLAFYNQNSTITSFSIRWNIPQRLYDF